MIIYKDKKIICPFCPLSQKITYLRDLSMKQGGKNEGRY